MPLALLVAATLAWGPGGGTPRALPRLRSATVMDADKPGRWALGGISDGAQRLESVKAAVVGAVSGSIAALPAAAVADGFKFAQWEYDVDTIAISCALFAITYRYAMREDGDMQVRMGVVGAFAVSRAAPAVHVSDSCLVAPLRCPPLGLYLDGTMLAQGVTALVVAGCAFAGAAAAIDAVIERGWLQPFPSVVRVKDATDDESQ